MVLLGWVARLGDSSRPAALPPPLTSQLLLVSPTFLAGESFSFEIFTEVLMGHPENSSCPTLMGAGLSCPSRAAPRVWRCCPLQRHCSTGAIRTSAHLLGGTGQPECPLLLWRVGGCLPYA